MIEGITTFLGCFVTFAFICKFLFDQYIDCIVRFMTFRKTQDGEIKDATKSGVAGKSN